MKNWIKLIVVAAWMGRAFVLTPVQIDVSKLQRPTYEDRDGYAVLSIVLDQHNHGSETTVISIVPTTVSEDRTLSSLNCGKKPEGFQAAEKDFHERNKTVFELAAKFSISRKYELSSAPRRIFPPPKPGEQELQIDAYAPAYFVSAVGFDAARTHAVAYVGAVCGAECGGGGYHFLVKDKKDWKEVPGSPACVWVSQNGLGSVSQAGA
jgi:hypothetical protein